MSEKQKHNYKPKFSQGSSLRHLNNRFFQLGLNDYRLGEPFKEFPNRNDQFFYERGRQYAVIIKGLKLTHSDHQKAFQESVNSNSLI